ncbi:phage tail tube protein [Desulfobulbus oligotrophicus]|uniref:Uncharacterized protein n=1 Tax=Desulfobulbus oligotrophicus TaxID=1909699 RepID=A0A7T5VEC2_9BACT|nr:hypothetical protein [Desulfobulbus oligotrophicus]QQG66359.1 hypothetical protein HP555_11010 [Desulfobulbus oligotrophicus]
MQNAQQGMILGGDLYFDFLTDAGASTGFGLAGNANRLIPKVESETLENKLNGRDTLGQTGDSYTRITSSTISFTMNRYDPDIVAAFFMGSAVDLPAVAAEAYTATVTADHGEWVSIGTSRLVTCVVRNSTDTITYAVGEDYEVDLLLGRIRTLAAGDIVDAATLHVSGTAAGPYTATVTAISDKWVPIGKDGLATCVVKNADNTLTYTVNEDYEVNLRLGLIRVLSGGDIVAGATLNISGAVEAATGRKITGGTRPVINVGLLLDGKNYVNGANVKLRVWQAQIRGDGDFDLLAQDGFPALQFSGTMVTPAGKTAPFELW